MKQVQNPVIACSISIPIKCMTDNHTINGSLFNTWFTRALRENSFWMWHQLPENCKQLLHSRDVTDLMSQICHVWTVCDITNAFFIGPSLITAPFYLLRHNINIIFQTMCPNNGVLINMQTQWLNKVYCHTLNFTIFRD